VITRCAPVLISTRGRRLAGTDRCIAGSDPMQRLENDCRIRDTADMEYSLEQMARSLVESGDYRVTSRLEPQGESGRALYRHRRFLG
jgi:hypothetical protein